MFVNSDYFVEFAVNLINGINEPIKKESIRIKKFKHENDLLKP